MARRLMMWTPPFVGLGVVAYAVLAGSMVGPAAPAAQAAADVFVNTTEDLPYDATLCLPGKPCSLRGALGRIEGRSGTIRACYDPAEVGGAKKCPPGWQPLRVADPGYDQLRKKWVFAIGEGRPPFEIGSSNNVIDFTKDIDSWASPADNRIVIDSGNNLELKQAISMVQSTGNKLMGFEVSGTYVLAGIDVLDSSSDNQFGPGLIFAGITSGAGIRFYGPYTANNRLVGSWCGVTGDGTVVNTVADDCVQIFDRAHDNVIGGTEVAERNVLGGSRLGVGVSIFSGAQGNAVLGSWIGLDGRGEPAEVNAGGVRISQEAHGARIAGNVISGNKGPGISIADNTRNVVIEDNRVGLGPDGEAVAANGEYGVRIIGAPKSATIQHNRIAFNTAGGVFISGSGAYDNLVSENSTSRNGGPAIQVLQGANRNARPPQITFASATEVQGLACRSCRVEVFSDPADQADTFEGTVDAAPDGLFKLVLPDGFAYRSLTATAADGRNTSGLSAPVAVTGASPTPPPGRTPTAVPTRDPGALTSMFLPWLGRGVQRR
jgi:parallel beta-helix repeat protein